MEVPRPTLERVLQQLEAQGPRRSGIYLGQGSPGRLSRQSPPSGVALKAGPPVLARPGGHIG